jgi:hypothetical protein
MKQLGLLILAVGFFIGCQHSQQSFKHQKDDSTIRGVLYIKDFTGNLYGGFAKQYFKDTREEILDSSSGETISKVQWVRDTTYYVLEYKPQVVGKDTVRDSLKHPILRPVFDLQIPKQYITPTSIVIPK